MPWVPEYFSAPALAQIEDKRGGQEPIAVSYFAGLMAGEIDALTRSFGGEPELHHPVRGRVRGARAFAEFAAENKAWLEQRDATIENVGVIITERRGVEEVVLHLGGEAGQVDLPVAIVADRQPDRRIDELRIYFSTWPLTGRHANRPPLLQPDPKLREPDVVGEYQSALATGDLEAIMAAFEPGAYAREPAGGQYIHEGPEGLREFYAQLFSNDGGIPLEHCTVTDNGQACALEYNVVRWGRTELPPEAGIAVYVRGENGGLAAARIYDDADPPLGRVA